MFSPTTGVRRQLKTPLDFLVVSDHAEMLGFIPRMYAGDPEIAQTVSGKAFLASARGEQKKSYSQFMTSLYNWAADLIRALLISARGK